MTVEIETLFQAFAILGTLFGCTWHLSSKLSALDANVNSLRREFDRHVEEDDERFRDLGRAPRPLRAVGDGL